MSGLPGCGEWCPVQPGRNACIALVCETRPGRRPAAPTALPSRGGCLAALLHTAALQPAPLPALPLLAHQQRPPPALFAPSSPAADALDAGDNSTLADLRTQFLSLDANADGQLSPAEFDAELEGYLPYGSNSTDIAPVSSLEWHRCGTEEGNRGQGNMRAGGCWCRFSCQHASMRQCAS